MAIPPHRPLTPVLIGRFVQLVRVPEAGVPNDTPLNVLLLRVSAPANVERVPVSGRVRLLASSGSIEVKVTVVPSSVSAPPLKRVKLPPPEAPCGLNTTPLIEVAVAMPRVTPLRVGLVANTNAPVPVSPVTAVARFALVGCARKAAIPAHRPLTPVLIGRFVQLVRVPDEGVPKGPPDVRPETAPVFPLKL